MICQLYFGLGLIITTVPEARSTVDNLGWAQTLAENKKKVNNAKNSLVCFMIPCFVSSERS